MWNLYQIHVFFISNDVIVLVYVDDCVLVSKDEFSIKNVVQSLKTGTKNVVFTLGGSLLSKCCTKVALVSKRVNYIGIRYLLIVAQILDLTSKLLICVGLPSS